MTQETEVPQEERCHKKPNLCNDAILTFGRNVGCVKEKAPLFTAGMTQLGYAVNPCQATHMKVNWRGRKDTIESFALTKNGKVVEYVTIDGEKGTKCISITERFCECDILNVVGYNVADKNIPADCVTVSIWIEPKCKLRPHREHDGLFEALFDIDTPINIPTDWAVIPMPTVRLNTLPAFITWAGDTATLKAGVYKIDYAMTIKTETSSALNLHAKLVIDGADYPAGGSSQHILAGMGGDISLAQGVTLKVPHGQTATIQLQSKVDVDSSVSTGTDCNLIIERVADSIDL